MCSFAANIYESCCHRGPVGDLSSISPCDSSQHCLYKVDPRGLERVVSRPGFCPTCRTQQAAGASVGRYRPRRIGQLFEQPETAVSERTPPKLLPPVAPRVGSPRKVSQPGTPVSKPSFPWPQSKITSTPSRTKTPRPRRSKSASSGSSGGSFLTPKASSPTSYQCSPGPLDRFSAMVDLETTPLKLARPQTPSSTHCRRRSPRRLANKRPRTPQSPETRPVQHKRRQLIDTKQQ